MDYLRRQRLRRFLNPKEDRKFVCRNKRAFISREDALALQPHQNAYKCKSCNLWHLSGK